MKPMTTHERIKRVYEHREPDRVPITDWLWESTWDRWKRAGLPEDLEYPIDFYPKTCYSISNLHE